MKTRFNFFALLLLLGIFVFSSCQDEANEVTDPPAGEVITTDSPIFSLLGRTSERDGSFDNILDGTSCSSVELPVTIVLAGIEIIIDSEDDLEVIEELFDEFDLDIEDIDFVFPIKIILPDHSKIVIENEDQLEDIIEGCIENGDDDDIECLDFKYPIIISAFDTTSNVPDVITIENDEQLWDFLDDLDEDDLISLQFPVTMILYDSTQVIVNNNDELEDLIEEVKDACDEDDDDDYDEDDVDDSEFVAFLIDGKWEITYFYETEDQTDLFESYIFKFLSEERVLVYNDQFEKIGEWDSDGDEGFIEFELEFEPGTLLSLITREWMVLEYDEDYFELMDDDVDTNTEDSVAFLTFERLEMDPGHNDSTMVSDIIVEGDWVVAKYEINGDNITEEFNDYVLEFTEGGGVIARRGNEVHDGGWNEGFDGEVQIFYLDFDNTSVFGELTNDWPVIDIREDRIELKIYEDDNNYEILVFERL